MFRERVELREYLEKTIQAGEARLAAQLVAAEKALSIQAIEYERRLSALNHAHEQARDKERDFIQRETYDIYVRTTGERLNKIEAGQMTFVDRDRLDAMVRGFDTRFEEISERIAEIERARANLDGRFSMLALVLFGGSVVINVLISLATHLWR
jgi:hypothetical protein